MLRVLHIVPSIPFGGLQRIAAELAAQQRRTGIAAEVLSLYAGEELNALLRTFEVPATVVAREQLQLGSLVEFAKVLRRGWDIIHVHAGLLWCNTLALLFKDCRVVFHAHNYPPTTKLKRIRLLNWVNGVLADAVFAVSNDVAKAWKAVVSTPVYCVHNGVAVPHHPPSYRPLVGRSEIVFGMATRLAADKGLVEFVQVASAISVRLPQARFLIAGSGPEEQSLKDLIREHGLSNAITLCGYVRDIESFWSKVDFALFTAPQEPFGLRILEPMRQAVPVLAYLTGAGSDEIMRPGVTVAAVPFNDSAGLADLAVDFVTRPEAAARMAGAAFEDVQKFYSIAAMSARVSDLYKLVP